MANGQHVRLPLLPPEPDRPAGLLETRRTPHNVRGVLPIPDGSGCWQISTAPPGKSPAPRPAERQAAMLVNAQIPDLLCRFICDGASRPTPPHAYFAAPVPWNKIAMAVASPFAFLAAKRPVAGSGR